MKLHEFFDDELVNNLFTLEMQEKLCTPGMFDSVSDAYDDEDYSTITGSESENMWFASVHGNACVEDYDNLEENEDQFTDFIIKSRADYSSVW